MKKIVSAILCLVVVFSVSAQEQKQASALLKQFLTSIGKNDVKATSSYFVPNGYIEAPYVESLGFPAKIIGTTAIEQAMINIKKAAPDFHFTRISIIMETPAEVVAEYEAEATMANGRPYHQLYMSHVISKDGKIVSLKEFLNTIAFVQAFFPNGLKDLINN